jgi:hypothetical protein
LLESEEDPLAVYAPSEWVVNDYSDYTIDKLVRRRVESHFLGCNTDRAYPVTRAVMPPNKKRES